MSIVAKRLGGSRWHLIGMEVGFSPGHIVLDGDSAALPRKGTEPPIVAHFYCGQTAGCIKMTLGMEVGFSPGNCVRWGPSSPPQKLERSPHFSAHVYCGQTAGWIKMLVGTEVGLGPGDIVL